MYSNLKTRFSERATDEVKQAKHNTTWPESGATSWQFGDLPESLEVERGGHQYLLYPAIVDKQDSVGVELLDSLQRAQEEHAIGLRRLVALCNAKDVKYVMRNLPSIDSMCLIYSTVGSCEVLRQGLLGLILSRSFFSDRQESSVRTEQQFLGCLKHGKPLMPEAKVICKTVADILTAYQTVTQQFKANNAKFPDASREDVLAQLQGLVFEDFLQDIPFHWLQHVPRFLQAMNMRLQKLSSAPASDEDKLRQIVPLLNEYQHLKNQPNAGSFRPELTQLKWMIEEFRVSLFAQTLKTSIPISVKRIEKYIASCR